MSVESSTNYISFTGNNSTSTPYAITSFYWFNDEDLVVTVVDLAGTETVLTLNTDYTVIGSGNRNGGSIVTTAAVPVTSQVQVLRVEPITQESTFNDNDAFPAAVIQNAFDKLTMICQQIGRYSSNSLRAIPSMLLSSFTPAANTVVGFGASATQPVAYTPAELLAFLNVSATIISGSQPTAAFLNTAARAAAVPGFLGQIGLQIDTGQLYRGTSLVAGGWTVYSAGTKSFADSTARGLSVPDFVGQFGVQIDTNATYRASGTSAGNWTQTTGTTSLADGSVTIAKLNANAKVFLTGIKGLVVTRPTTSTVSLTMEEAILGDGSGGYVKFTNPAAITVNLAASGLNGLDTGSEASNIWYHVHLVSNGTILGAVFSTSATSPTMPVGYTYKEYASVYRNDGSSNLINTSYLGKRADGGLGTVLSAFTYTGATTVDLSAYLPPNVTQVRGFFYSVVTGANLGFFINGITQGTGSQSFAARSSTAIASALVPYTFALDFEIKLAGQSVSIGTSNHAYYLVLRGYDI